MTVRQLRHLAAELRAIAEGLDAVTDVLAPDTGLDYPPQSLTARLYRLTLVDRAGLAPPD